MTATAIPAATLLEHGSTLPVDCAPTIGVRPGAAWVGLAARIGRDVVDASVISRDLVCPEEDRDRPLAVDWLCDAVAKRITAMAARHDRAARAWCARHGFQVAPPALPFQVAVARPSRPAGASIAGARNMVAAAELAGWLRGLYGAAMVGPFPAGAVHKRANGGTGVADDYFPPTLIGRRRPDTWLPHDGAVAARGERDHEQDAYHAAGLACLAGHARKERT